MCFLSPKQSNKQGFHQREVKYPYQTVLLLTHTLHDCLLMLQRGQVYNLKFITIITQICNIIVNNPLLCKFSCSICHHKDVHCILFNNRMFQYLSTLLLINFSLITTITTFSGNVGDLRIGHDVTFPFSISGVMRELAKSSQQFNCLNLFPTVNDSSI